MWKKFPGSIVYYARDVSECCIYGLPEMSDSIADVDANDVPLSDLPLLADILGGKETFVRVIVTRMLVQLSHSKTIVCSKLAGHILDRNTEIGEAISTDCVFP